jgi:Protein of unknown function (DUF3987)/Bifunctional DNA primase/polymerase, N-terminal/Primase C terminal 2 (PriCT-2)
MTAFPQVQQHPASVDAYIRHGWSLVPIPMGTKGPRTPGWNLKENALRDQTQLPPGYGIGLAHAYSGTMALDIDEWASTAAALAQHGVDLQALYDANDAVIVDSGRAGHGKLLYAMPFGLALPSKKILISGITAYELRCATASGLTVQDVMPPSIHPDTQQPYRWAGKGHWMRLPTIPQPLLDLWQSMLAQDSARTISTGGQVDASWQEIRQALEVVPSDCSRDEWVSVGMALHWAGTQTNQLDQALALWNEWSMQSQAKYPGEAGIMTQWVSFKSDKATAVKLGTLFHIAKQHGWQRPMPDAASLFSAVKSDPIEPIHITTSIRPPAPDMDMSLWPSILRNRSQEVSDSVGCDPLVPLFAGLSAVCGVVDAQIRLELMPGFKVPPVLWLMTLGDPADKKSPGSRPMLAPLKNIELEDRPRYGKELLDWEGKEAAHAAAKKNFLEWSATPDAMLGGDAPSVSELPAQPVPLKITVSDITSQKLVRSAAERPRGLLCYLDEMNSWIKKMTDKTSGEDRSAWVVSYESEPYEMDRVGAGAIHADNLAVSIYGNIQPRVFKENLASLSSDGLLQRFIPAILRGNKTRLGNPVPEYLSSATTWENTLRMVYALPPMTYRLSPEAFKAFRDFQAWYEEAKQDERLLLSNDTFMTAFGKLEGTAGRLILIFHIIENPFSPMVDMSIVHRVIDLIRGYIIPAFRYALGELSGVDLFDQWVADYIIQHFDKGHMTMSELKRGARRQLEGKSTWIQDQMILGAMQMLEQGGWVMRLDDGTKEHLHIAEWMINPALGEKFAEHRKRVILVKQRQREHIYRLSPNPVNPVKGYTPDMDE